MPSAATLILLPGMDGSGALFADFVTMLAPHLMPLVVRYPCDQPLDYSGLIDFVLPQLPKDRPFVLLGESFSGPIAISIAAMRPPHLTALVLSCSFATYPMALMRRLKFLTPLLPMQRQLARFATPFLFGKYSTSRLSTALHRALDGVSADTLRMRLRSVLEVDTTDLLQDIMAPMLYLQAAQDRIVTSAAQRHLAQHIPAMKTVCLSGPHLLLQTRPEHTARIIGEFILAARIGGDVYIESVPHASLSTAEGRIAPL